MLKKQRNALSRHTAVKVFPIRNIFNKYGQLADLGPLFGQSAIQVR